MAIKLADLRQAVTDYLATKVTVTVTDVSPSSGQQLNPGETFFFRVAVTNASTANDGVALTEVTWEFFLINPAGNSIARLFAPAGGTVTDCDDIPVVVGSEGVCFFYRPSSTGAHLEAGETHTIDMAGKALPNTSGGTFTIQATVFARPNLDQLFPTRSRKISKAVPIFG